MTKRKNDKSVGKNKVLQELPQLQSKLLAWGVDNFRDYPWRATRNPYNILISEVMLHRTQAEQVVPVYLKFIEKFPDVRSIGEASEYDIYEIMRPLGLKWRIDLVHPMAVFLIEHYQGEIPKARDELILLPGVSEYIAGAVRCFAWDMHEAIADTNTIRITGRIFGLITRDSSRRSKRFKNVLLELVPPSSSRDFNYALLDLGNKLCVKRMEPLCGQCPIQQFCKYGLTKISEDEIIL